MIVDMGMDCFDAIAEDRVEAEWFEFGAAYADDMDDLGDMLRDRDIPVVGGEEDPVAEVGDDDWF